MQERRLIWRRNVKLSMTLRIVTRTTMTTGTTGTTKEYLKGPRWTERFS